MIVISFIPSGLIGIVVVDEKEGSKNIVVITHEII